MHGDSSTARSGRRTTKARRSRPARRRSPSSPDMARPYEPLWQPSAERVAATRMSDFIAWLSERRGISFTDYQALWKWSVSDLEGFWVAVWDYFEVRGTRPDRVLYTTEVP